MADPIRAEVVLQASPLVVFAFDADGTCTLSEGGGLAALGLRPGELVGRDLLALYGADWDGVRRCLEGEASTTRSQLGGRTLDVYLTPVRDAAGEVVGGMGTCVDVTEVVAREATLARRAEGAARLLHVAGELGRAAIDRPVLLRRAAELALDVLDADAAVVYVADDDAATDGRVVPEAVVHRDATGAEQVRAALAAVPLDVAACGVADLGLPGLGEAMLVPLLAPARALLAVARAEGRAAFGPADLARGEDLASVAAASLAAAAEHGVVRAELEVRRQNEEAAARQVDRSQRRATVMAAIAAAPPEDGAVAAAAVRALGEVLDRPLALRLLGGTATRAPGAVVHHPDPAAAARLADALGRSSRAPLDPEVLAPVLERTTSVDGPAALAALPEPFAGWARVARLRQLLFVPVRARERVLGLFTTWTAGDAEPPAEADVRLLEEVAERAGLALDNARLVAEAHRRAAEQAAVADLSRRALAGRSLPSTFAAAVAAAADVLDAAEVVAVELVPGDAHVAVRAASRSSHVAGDRLALEDDAWAASAVRGRRHLLVTEPGDPTLPPGAGSGAWAAITDGTQVVGAVLATHPEHRWFGDGDAGFLHAVATVLGTAMTRRAGELALRHQAEHDALTGLPNRRHLAGQLEAAVDEGCALLLMDVDRFKEVNDTLGHGVGDELLITVGERVRRAVGSRGTVARLGGDEFAVLVRHGGLADGVAVAEAVADALDEPLPVGGSLLWVRASIGVAAAPEHGPDAGALLRHADVAMYDAKGRTHPVATYDPSRHEDQRDRLDLAPALRRAIADGSLRCRFQPQIDLTTGRVRSFEALVRWQHEDRGLLAPAAFIDLAEHTGLIRPLTQWVLHEALEQEARWLRSGLDVAVSVNLSPRMLHEATLVDEVRDALAAAGVPPDRLILELTETAMLEQPVAAMEVMEQLAGGGVRLSIDDFGTGYSSLSYLQRLPFAEIKVDRSFVTAMADSPGDQAIVEAVVGLAHSLGVEVVAEGIETEHVLRLLRNLGCDLGQGYHVGLPVPAAEASRMLAASAGRRSRTSA